MLDGQRAGVPTQVQFDAFFRQGPTGGPQRTVPLNTQLTGLPRVFNHATKRRGNNQTHQHRRHAQQPLEHFTTPQGGGFPRIIEQRHDGTTVHLGRGTIVPPLYRYFLRDNGLHIQDHRKAQGQYGKTSGNTQQRGVEGVEGHPLITQALILPRPGDIDAQERDGGQYTNAQPKSHRPRRPLFRRVIINREAFFPIGNGHVVKLGAQARQLTV